MKSMRTTLIVGLLSALAATPLFAAKPGWTENLAEAQSTAAAQKKHVLLNFTGSDWCGWCIKIDKEVFSKPDFKNLAHEKLILVEIDFPESKTLPETVRSQNSQLKQKYGVEGFPTLVLLDSSGKETKRWVGFKQQFLQELTKAVGGR
jgi:protein disulfide-isomerase